MNNNTPFTQSISLKDIGIENAKIHYQLSANELHEMTIALGQGIEISNGALALILANIQDALLMIDLL